MTTQEIADFVGGELVGDGSIEISGIASLTTATDNELSFAESVETGISTNAACILVPTSATLPTGIIHIKVGNPKLAFVRIARKLEPSKEVNAGVHPTAVIDSTAIVTNASIGAFVSVGASSIVGEGCRLGEGARIGRNVRIGRDTVINANCVIYDNVVIGSNSVIHAGVVIGAPGFGYVKDDDGEYHQFPQIGRVLIGDSVEIGANTCIDRGALGDTRIGDGTKIDNLVQVGHNVQIGKRVVIAAQTGISGSTVIEDDCVIGGQVGFGDHARVRSGAVIGSQAGILPGKIVRPGVWWGTPIQPLEDFKRQNALVKGLQRMKDEISEIKSKLR